MQCTHCRRDPPTSRRSNVLSGFAHKACDDAYRAAHPSLAPKRKASDDSRLEARLAQRPKGSRSSSAGQLGSVTPASASFDAYSASVSPPPAQLHHLPSPFSNAAVAAAGSLPAQLHHVLPAIHMPALGIPSAAVAAEVAAATAALHVPPLANTHEPSPLRDAALTPADCWARHRWVRYRRLAEIAALRARILALLPLKYGKYKGVECETLIAGLVRQLDILHATCVTLDDQNKLLLGEMASLAFRISSTCGITRDTHKIVSIKLLITRPAADGEEAVGEQMIHWDFSNAYLARDMYTMLWHLSEGAGQRTTALPRFAAYHQPDERTMARKVPVAVHGDGKEWEDETCAPDLRPFLRPLFHKRNFHDDACAIGDCTFFDERDSHYGTANASPHQERVVAFFQFVPNDLDEEQAKHADEDQSYEWVQAGLAHGVWGPEYFEALTRNAHEKAMHRIQPAGERNKCIAWMKQHYPALVEQYNQRAPAGFTI